MQFKNVAVVGKHQSEVMVKHVLHIAQYLTELKINVFIDCYSENSLFISQGFKVGCLVDWLDSIDLVIVIGGDGTLLSVARKVIDFKVPIVGINQGKLGFMTDIVVEEMIQVIHSIIINKDYTTEYRTLLYASVLRDSKTHYHSVALNDVVISRGAIGHMIEFNIEIDDQFVLSQKSDGVIFTTPTGSTAYSLAAGGPILHPNANVFSLVPICPQSLTNRPLVISENSVIEFILARENATQIHFDGQECFDLNLNDRVILKKYPNVLQLIHPIGYNYYRTLRKKLEWSKRVS